MKFTFLTKGGNEYTLDLDPTVSIREVKQFFQMFYSLNWEKINIIYHNRILSDSETLSNFIDLTFPGLYIISDEIHDFDDENVLKKKSPSSKSNIFFNPKSNSIFQNDNKFTFHRLTSSEALEYNLIDRNYSKTSKISKIYPDNFTSFKAIIINSSAINAYEDYSNIPTHTVTADRYKTIGEVLKTTVAKNACNEYNSINNYFILRSKTHMIQHSRLYEYNLHSLSMISFNCESVVPKFVNVIVFMTSQNIKKQQVSYNLYKETYVLDFKKTVARDFFGTGDPNCISLFTAPNNIMVDDRRIKDYNFVSNANIEVKESKITSNDVMVVVERLLGSFGITLRSKCTVYELEKQIHEQINIPPSKQILICNHQMIIKEFQERVSNLSQNKVYAVQLRTKSDPVYGVEFESGVIYYFDVKDDQNVLNLKIQIHDIMEIPISHICLIYNYEVLKDESMMGELSITYFSVITCKKQGFYENIPIKLKTPFLDVQKYISPQTYVKDVADIALELNNTKFGEKVNVYIPILLFDQNTKLSQIEHHQDTKFVLCERRSNSFVITIKTVFNDLFYLPVFPEMTVRHLISLIRLLLNIDTRTSSGSLRLMCYGIILREIYTLGQYKLKQNTIIDAYLYPF